MRAGAARRSSSRRAPRGIAGAQAAPFPGFVTPSDPTLREQAPSGSDWLHEIKIDGYRAQLHIRNGQIRVYSRSGYDWTEQFHQIAQAAQALTSHDLIIDGEATVLGNTGLPDFQQLRRELAKKHSDRLIYHAFDLLYLDGYDLRRARLIERKAALRGVLAREMKTIAYAEFFEGQDGETCIAMPASSASRVSSASGSARAIALGGRRTGFSAEPWWRFGVALFGL